MSWKRAMLVPLLAVLGACAEGGIRGSGISTSVVGNVTSVNADGTVAGVRVAIAGRSVATTTDREGAFSLVGPFDGSLTVRFAPPGGGAATLPINVPAAGVLTLNDVRIDTAQGTAEAEQQIEFDGVVVETDCAAATMRLASAAEPAGDDYEMDLTTSMLQDAQGNPVPCAAVRIGEPATVSGDVYPSGVFGHCVVVLTE